MKRKGYYGSALKDLFTVISILLLVGTAAGQDIVSFDHGYLTFTNTNPALYYTIEFRPSLEIGTEWDGDHGGLKDIHTTNPTISVPVGFFYRVVGRSHLSPVEHVPRTGQTSLYFTGDDGDSQAGSTWPTPRFTDNDNGTVTDNLTHLVWLKNANAFGLNNWANAIVNCNTLSNGMYGLSDGSLSGQWRLPNVQEQLSLVDWGVSDPAISSGHPFSNVQESFYWTSSLQTNDGNAWVVNEDVGDLFAYAPENNAYVWPVRDMARFVNNNDGTITDIRTGLVWLKNANAFGQVSWTEALTLCNTLTNGMHGLSDGSSAGEWRLPNTRELLSLVSGNDMPVFEFDYMFTDFQQDFYWTGTTYRRSTGSAWTMNFFSGVITAPSKASLRFVFPVRGPL